MTVIFDTEWPKPKRTPRHQKQRRYQVEFFLYGRWCRQDNARSSFHTKFWARVNADTWDLKHGIRARVIDTKEF